jgi:hypothetical protein
MTPARRRLARLALLAATGAALLLGAWALLVEPNQLRVNHHTIALPSWPGEPLRVAVLSDLHVGSPFVDLERVRAIVAQANAERPDLVLLLGDFVGSGVLGGTPVAAAEYAPLLGALDAPLGAFAVLGNHDWWEGGPAIRAALEAAGVSVLENEHALVRHRDQPLALVGLADPMTRTPRIAPTLAPIAAGLPTLAFCHSPDVFPDVPPQVSITFAGHTHGGQVRLPIVGALVVPSKFGQRYALGHILEGGRHLFVTTGIGTSTLPLRLGVPPEIAVVTLQSAPPAD